MMEEILIEPTEEWLPEAAAYKRAFEAAGDSMDGTGSLRRAQDMAQWLQTCRDFKRRETTPPQLVPATQLIYVRPADHALLGMLQLCVTAAFFQNFWAVQAAVDIPFAAAAKNAWLLCLLRPGMTVLGLGVNALLLIPAVLFFPLSLPYVLLFPCGLSGFASGMIGWSSCKRYLIR